jgi:hypothetical protein
MTNTNVTLHSRGLPWVASLLLSVPLAAQALSGGAIASPDDGSAEPFPQAALPVQWADFDNDGLDDALVVTTDGGLALLQSQADGTFVDVSEWAGLEPVTDVIVTVFQDYDHDGWADLFAGTANGRAHLMQNLGGSFLDVTQGSGIASQGAAVSAHWMDYDADGLLDLHLVTDRENILFHAQGSWSFAPIALPLAAAGGASTSGGLPTDESVGDPGGPDASQRPAPTPTGMGAQAPASGATVGTGSGVLGGTPGGVGTRTKIDQGQMPSTIGCASGVPDQAGSGCILASSVPTLGMLYPLSDKFFVDAATGNVGIGTTTPDVDTRLHVKDGLNTRLRVDADKYSHLVLHHNDASYGEALVVLAESPNGQDYEPQWLVGMDSHPSVNRGDFAIKNENNADAYFLIDHDGGNVGIGTTTPAYTLDVNGTAGFSGDVTVADPTWGHLKVNGGHASLSLDRSDTDMEAQVRFQTAGAGDWYVGPDNLPAANASDFSIKTTQNDPPEFMIEQATGRVGIGTAAPAYSLDIDIEGEEATLGLDRENEFGDAKVAFSTNGSADWSIGVDNSPSLNKFDFAIKTGGFTKLLVQKSTGFVGINTLQPAHNLEVDGTARVQGSMAIGGTHTATEALDVDGSIRIRGGADIVETFESSCGLLEPGTVVVIDPENPGSLMCSSTAYDTKVAGVVSGAGGVNPGLLLGQDDVFTGDTKVAMTGRVYVNCSTENGPIVPGDRLTTATREGHAMRVSEELPSSGSVIGKAMSSLESGSGLVLVLVNLQ